MVEVTDPTTVLDATASNSVLITHHFGLDDIQEAYEVFSQQRGGVLKVALYPDASRVPAGRRAAAEAVA